jgi:Raf kinase inhibitor-like YbhB/YbcL family protein
MPKKCLHWILFIGLLIALAGCTPALDPTELAPPEVNEEASAEEAPPENTEVAATVAAPTEEPSAEEEIPMEMTIMSPAFENEAPIPVQFSCDGENYSPELIFDGIPEGTASLVLIMDDPDAPVGLWVHWVLFNLPADITGLPEGATGVGLDGLNSWGETGYGGPCPPGGTHRYFFKLYALDISLDLDAGATKDALESAMEGHILAQAEWMGTYSR